MRAGLRKRRRGQAMVEYSVALAFVGLALFAGPMVKVPNPKKGSNGQSVTVFYLMMDAYQIYNDSFYFALCAPLP